MVRATFQETWIMGTIDLTFLTLFHSKRSRASWYWYAAKAPTGNGEEGGHGSPAEKMSAGLTVERPHVPGDVVAPAHRLDPVYRPGVDPH